MSYERERNEQYNDIPVEIVDNMLLITSRAEVSLTLSKILCKWQGLIKNGNTPVKKYSKLINC